jgi:hypothetical protein
VDAVRIESVELTAARRERMGIVWNGRRFLGGVLGNKAGAEEPSRAIGAGAKAAIDFIQGRRSMERVERAEHSRDTSRRFKGHSPH